MFQQAAWSDSAKAGAAGPIASAPNPIRRYCDVTGYVAPQNKFELKLPPTAVWNHKFYFYACGGFCGSIGADAANFGLERGYASATGNGGHDSALGFDGVWAANAPELQEDFGWRSNHVVTLVTKAITTHYYGQPIRFSYMAGNSKGGEAVLMEAQRFPEDFDGLMPSAPYTTTPAGTRLQRLGLQRPSATATAARSSTTTQPRSSISQCCSTAALRLA